MSAIIMVRGVNGVVAAADGVFYDEDMRVTGFGSKILLMPEASTVIIAQGLNFLLPLLRLRICYVGGEFDEIKDRAPKAIEDTISWLRRESGVMTNAKVLIGGFSLSKSRFETYRICSQAEGDTPAFTLAPTPTVEAAPWAGPEVATRYGLDDPALMSGDPFDVIFRFMASARHTSCPNDLDPSRSGFQVGGFVQVAMLTEDGGCSTSIAHRWPDRVGELIDPNAGQNCAPEVVRDI